jgi:hypothetical protein
VVYISHLCISDVPSEEVFNDRDEDDYMEYKGGRRE